MTDLPVWRMVLAGFTLIALSGMFGGPASAVAKTNSDVVWFASWAASATDVRNFPPAILAPTIDTISDQTIRQTLTISHGGSQVRVRFSNEMGATALHIGAASVGYRTAGSQETRRVALTFSGASSIKVPAGAPILSDPVSLSLPS